jgi:starch-binding outer membrane protein, SusD/RagB family
LELILLSKIKKLIKMKNKIIYHLVAILILVTFGSCKKFLDQKPITDVSTNIVFNDVESAKKAVIGAYSRLTGDAGYGIRLSLYYPLDTDEMQGPTGAADNDRRDIARYAASPSNAQLTNPFNQIFQGIEYSNLCIANIPKMDMYTKGSDLEKKQLKRLHGEALTLRAVYYLEAIRNWGDMPSHLKPAEELAASNPFPSRVDRDSILTVLIEDLRIAADLMPWRNEVATIGDVVDERITKGTTKALRARLALYRGGFALRQNGTMVRKADYLDYYAIARSECNDIINSGQHSLNPNYKALWKDNVCARVNFDANGELMFQASGIGATGTGDTKLGYYNGPRVNNFGNSSVNPMPTYFYLFDSLDTRRDVTIAPYNVNLNLTKAGTSLAALNDGKYRRDWISNPTVLPTNAIQYFTLKWQIIRYSDVLLMFAEAENELNGATAQAYNAINTVRRRGFGVPLNVASTFDITSGLSKQDFFKALVRERALELGGEGIRKYDLIRWNLLAAAITETRANVIRMSTNAAIVNPTYMADYPSYATVGSLPARMFVENNSMSDVLNMGNLFRNSLYNTSASSVPSGTTAINWINLNLAAAGTTSPAGRFATGFVIGKSELLPIPQPARDANVNLSQNYGY